MSDSPREFFRRLDWFMVACVVGVILFGLIFVASAASSGSDRFFKHVVFVVLGIGVMIVTARLDYAVLVRHGYTIFAISIITLLTVLLTRPVNNATSWFDLGIIKVQPSEFAKVALVLVLAKYLSESESYRTAGGLVTPLLITMAPSVLILLQPDLGTAMVFIPVCFAMLYAAGARWRHLSMAGGVGLGAVAFMYAFVLHDYQKRRIEAWLDPTRYSAEDAYQLLQSRIALGSGGLWGKGVGCGTQNKLGFVPVRDSDFILSVIGEEAGFVGAAALVLLFLMIFAAGFGICERTREPGGRMVAVGVVVLLATQTFINVGVAVGLLPTTGVTLPFVSYGGSSMLTCCIAMGMLLSVGSHPHWVISKDDFAA